jgi:hypothetical protein
MIHDKADVEDMYKMHGVNGDHAVDTLRYLVQAMDVQPDKRVESKTPYEMGSRNNRQGYVLRSRTAA